MKVDVSTNVKAVTRQLRRIDRKQIPFAAAGALNDLAFGYRKEAIALWARSVNVKQRNFARAAFRVGKANKRHLRSSVFDSLDRSFLPRQISGGVKTPYSSSKIAIPTQAALTATGRVRKAARLGTAKNTFRATIGGQDGIWQRHGRGQGKIRLLYVLTDRAFVPKAFPFFRAGQRYAERNFSRFMDSRLKRALATARR